MTVMGTVSAIAFKLFFLASGTAAPSLFPSASINIVTVVRITVGADLVPITACASAAVAFVPAPDIVALALASSRGGTRHRGADICDIPFAHKKISEKKYSCNQW